VRPRRRAASGCDNGPVAVSVITLIPPSFTRPLACTVSRALLRTTTVTAALRSGSAPAGSWSNTSSTNGAMSTSRVRWSSAAKSSARARMSSPMLSASRELTSQTSSSNEGNISRLSRSIRPPSGGDVATDRTPSKGRHVVLLAAQGTCRRSPKHRAARLASVDFVMAPSVAWVSANQDVSLRGTRRDVPPLGVDVFVLQFLVGELDPEPSVAVRGERGAVPRLGVGPGHEPSEGPSALR
jgi:hypothetical protein